MLQHLQIEEFTTLQGEKVNLQLSYELFGRELHTAPVVVVNHALTGNSRVTGKDGWWSALVGEGKCIDTRAYTVISFNVPGNGYDGYLIERYKDFVAGDIAAIFLKGLELLGIKKLYALIGGSLGGGLAWEMAALNPSITEHLIPVASDWKATDWLIANCQIQEQILLNSREPVQDARMHAMLCYRTPASFKERFQRSTNEEQQRFNVETWLIHHGEKLQSRFQLSAYKLANHLLKTIDINRNGEDAFRKLQESNTHIHIIGVDSDLFFIAEENQETYRQLARARSNVTYGEIRSIHGHDAFLLEFEQLEALLRGIFQRDRGPLVLKFGGRSLANGSGLRNVTAIIREKLSAEEKLVVVASARGKATDQLHKMLQLAASGRRFEKELKTFREEQLGATTLESLEENFLEITALLNAVARLGAYSREVEDRLLAQGELISVKFLQHTLESEGIDVMIGDSRQLIRAERYRESAIVDEHRSRDNIKVQFKELSRNTVLLLPGFIAADNFGNTITLGRNGSNYTAALVANFLEARELQNYTHVDGIYTADPELVRDARRIDRLSFEDANEMVGLGTTILHAKTIIPLLEKNIPLRVLNTFRREEEGTLISAEENARGIRCITASEDRALVYLEGRGLLDKAGIDARIFGSLGQAGISVGIISQGSSERGIGLVVKQGDARRAKEVLEAAFEDAFEKQDINRVSVREDVAVISLIGQDLSEFHRPYNALIKNQVIPLLFNNTVTGRNICLVVEGNDLHKAMNVIHGQVFGVSKKINIALFGHGNVGGTLLDQLHKSVAQIDARKGIQLQVFAIANSRQVLLDAGGIGPDWESRLTAENSPYEVKDIIDFARRNHLENLIAVDNTASTELVDQYTSLVRNGFDLVSSNKIANTLDHHRYRELRKVLKEHQQQYLYETNVGAGLPLIDTLKLLHLSGENITRIRGVFSGSLSYLFNRFSGETTRFSDILADARKYGLTEPDPREDLSGADVGRKLLILARELDLENEPDEVVIENLIPARFRGLNRDEFLLRLPELDEHFENLKTSQPAGNVLRYVGDLHGDLQQSKGVLEVRLESVAADSVLGRVRGADSIIEIFTESYGDQPLVIQGAGAGAAVTARGVLGDILRIAERN